MHINRVNQGLRQKALEVRVDDPDETRSSRLVLNAKHDIPTWTCDINVHKRGGETARHRKRKRERDVEKVMRRR